MKHKLDEFWEAAEEERNVLPGWVVERRRGVTEQSELSLEDFCSWWKTQPPLFDDAPMWRPLYWDATLESVFRAHSVGQMTVEMLLGEQIRKPVRDWLRLLFTINATNRATQDKLSDMSSGQKADLQRNLISKDWNPKQGQPTRQLQIPGQPPTMPRGSMVVPTQGRFVLKQRRPIGAPTMRERVENSATKAQSA